MKRKGGTELAGQQKTIEKNVSRVIAISSSHSGKYFVQPYQQFWKHMDLALRDF